MENQTFRHAVSTDARLNAVAPAAFAILLGVFLLFGVGFAHPDIIHNAAHDSRHSISFPCH